MEAVEIDTPLGILSHNSRAALEYVNMPEWGTLTIPNWLKRSILPENERAPFVPVCAGTRSENN